MLEPMDLYIRQIRFKRDRGHQVEYRQTDHYQLTRRFLENPEKMLRDLLL